MCVCGEGCVGVFGTRVSCAKTVEPIEIPFGGLTHVGQRNHILDGVQTLHEKRHFWWGHVPAHYNVPTAGECAYPAHEADEYIRRREG